MCGGGCICITSFRRPAKILPASLPLLRAAVRRTSPRPLYVTGYQCKYFCLLNYLAREETTIKLEADMPWHLTTQCWITCYYLPEASAPAAPGALTPPRKTLHHHSQTLLSFIRVRLCDLLFMYLLQSNIYPHDIAIHSTTFTYSRGSVKRIVILVTWI